MKKQVLRWSLILVALFGLGAVSTSAQTANGVRANVPFDFTVGDKTVQAGKIFAGRVSGSDVGPMSISNVDIGQSAFRFARSLTASDISDQAKLVFHKYGDRYYLAEVWVPGYKAWQLLESNSERAIRREMRLAKNTRPEAVVVLADMQ